MRTVRLLGILLFTLTNLVGVGGQDLPSELQSQGVIHNSGTIRIRGNATITQDNIGGRVEYVRSNSGEVQTVAHTTYYDLFFSGAAVKQIADLSRPIRSTNLWHSLDASTVFSFVAGAWAEASGTIHHSGIINPGNREGRFVANGTVLQDMLGKGTFAVLEIANVSNVLVTQEGGLNIFGRLDLQRGTLQNSPFDNVKLADSAWIWRSDEGSISNNVETSGRLNVRYYGNSEIVSGAELPPDASTLYKLYQDVRAGITLASSPTVNDSLVLRGHIRTELGANPARTLTFTPPIDPRYIDEWPEIDGLLIRTGIQSGTTYTLNSQHHTIYFADVASLGDVRSVRMRSKPLTVPDPPDLGADKIKRYYQFQALDAGGQSVADDSFIATFGYAWRSEDINGITDVSPVEDIPLLIPKLDELVLLRNGGAGYIVEGVSSIPVTRGNVWRHSYSIGVRNNGDFAIGLSQTRPQSFVRARLFLEGAIPEIGENIVPEMHTELRNRNLVPDKPPSIYPYTLDPLHTGVSATALPDSVVDWIVVELRTQATGGDTFYSTGLLTRSGYVISARTFSLLSFNEVQEGDYYIVFHHRNHLPVMTETARRVTPGESGAVVDMTSGLNTYGGSAAMRLIGTSNGGRLFGLVGGYVTADFKIDRSDYNLVWDNRDGEGYLLYDTNMDGIVSTDDLNLTWNNKGRQSAVP